MKTAKTIDLVFVYGVNDVAREKLRLLLPGHFARRRNSPACSAEVLRISFLALSMDIVRTGGTVRAGALGGGVGVVIVSFSMGNSPIQ
jgi:hypothetical protein